MDSNGTERLRVLNGEGSSTVNCDIDATVLNSNCVMISGIDLDSDGYSDTVPHDSDAGHPHDA